MKLKTTLFVFAILFAVSLLAQDKMIEFPKEAFTKWLTDNERRVLCAEINGHRIQLEYNLYTLDSTENDKFFNKLNGKPQSHTISVFYLPNGKLLFYHYKIWEYHYSKDPTRPTYLGDKLRLHVSSYFFEKKRGFWPWQWHSKFVMVHSYDGLSDQSEEESRASGIDFLKKRYGLTSDLFWW